MLGLARPVGDGRRSTVSAITERVEIEAPVSRVWQLLRDEAQLGVDAGRARIIREERLQALSLEVQMGFMFRVRHDYRLERGHDRETCYITDEIQPSGARWMLSNLFLFGKGINAILAAANQGLQNLKAVAQSGDTPTDAMT